MCEAGHGQIDREVQCNLGNLPPLDCPRDVDDVSPLNYINIGLTKSNFSNFKQFME